MAFTKTGISALILLLLILAAGYADHIQPQVKYPHIENSLCRDPKERVYSPDRLKLLDPCIQVTGVVESVRYEQDGDYHVNVRLDPEFEYLINDANKRYQRGWLVVEPVCEHPTTVPEPEKVCGDVLPTIPLPVVGQHVSVLGPYVEDQEHHNWAEIHPAWEIKEIP